MSRGLWKLDLPQPDVTQRRVNFKLDLPPQSALLDVRWGAQFEPMPALWIIGDLDEPCVSRRFQWVQTGEKIEPGYSFVGLVQFRGIMSFGLFVAG